MSHAARVATGVALVAFLLSAGPAVHAGDADSATGSALGECRRLADDAQRLRCYDALASAVAPAVATTRTASPDNGFGAQGLNEAEAKSVQSRLPGRVEQIKKGQRYKLENAQIWLNVDDRDRLVEFDNPAITITRNFAGSYWMSFDGHNVRVRVRRVQ